MNNISSDVFILFANLNSREKFTFQKLIIADEVLKQYTMMLKFELIQLYVIHNTTCEYRWHYSDRLEVI